MTSKGFSELQLEDLSVQCQIYVYHCMLLTQYLKSSLEKLILTLTLFLNVCRKMVQDPSTCLTKCFHSLTVSRGTNNTHTHTHCNFEPNFSFMCIIFKSVSFLLPPARLWHGDKMRTRSRPLLSTDKNANVLRPGPWVHYVQRNCPSVCLSRL